VPAGPSAGTSAPLVAIAVEASGMKLLDRYAVDSGTTSRHIELYHGDLSSIPPEEAVDVLVVSAFPNDYRPTPGSLIGALHRQGLSVDELARRKAVDLRNAFSCWLSEDIGAAFEKFGFRRILCFEPRVRGAPAEVVGEIFQSLMPFAYGDQPIRTLAMPLVASGDQGSSVSEMLSPLLEAASRWLALGLPIERLKIVEHSETKAAELARHFADLKSSISPFATESRKQFAYDLFISYSQENSSEVDFMIEELRHRRPHLRIFLDRQDIDLGHSWQQTIFEAMDDCRTIVTVYSPPYLQSKVCKEEFHIALHRHRESETGVLFPVYLFSAELPTYMKLVQHVDCRESDAAKLTRACEDILEYVDASSFSRA
jgi:hypothetical protein